METLVAQVQESCSAAVLDATDIVYVMRVPTHKIMRITLGVTGVGLKGSAGLAHPAIVRPGSAPSSGRWASSSAAARRPEAMQAGTPTPSR